jgi:uncharacterized protein (TIGR02001 family)
MKKSIQSLAIAAAFAPIIASAQTPPAPAPEPSPVTGNMTIASDYRFRGVSQTYNGPAIQGGIDYAHSSGVYLGNWNSNVSSILFSGGSGIEMDFYGGWKKSFGDFGIDLGAIYYYYHNAEWNTNTGATAGNAKFDNTELYVGASWKWLSAKLNYAISDYFGLANEMADGGYFVHKEDGTALGGKGGSSGTWYFDLTATIPVSKEFNIIAHYGKLDVKNYDDLSYSDWKLGVTYDLAGWMLGAAYIDTNAKSEWYYTFGSKGNKEIAKSTVVLSVMKSF